MASTTRYRCLRRPQALLVLAVFLGFATGCLMVSPQVSPQPGNSSKPGDVALYTAVVDGIAAGGSYYQILGTELQARGYPVRSVFNWRTPLHLELIAHLPGPDWGRMLLAFCALCTILLAASATYRSGGAAIAALQLLLFCLPLAITAMPAGLFFGEVWAGTLMAAAAALAALGWRKTGAISGILALFFRELAVPFGLVNLFFAWREQRKSEAWIWTTGLACYAVYFGLHARAVSSHIPPAAMSEQISRWLQFGGLHFVLITSRVGLLLAMPYWVAATYLPLSVLGVAGWRNAAANRVTAAVIVYIAGFSVIGMPQVNFYWGAIYAPLLAFGGPWALAGCRDLLAVVWEPGAPRSQDTIPAAEGVS